MDARLAPWLAGPDGQAAIALAAALPGNALGRSTALRAAGLEADEAAAVLTQIELATLPQAPPGWLLTRDGLEQGTRAVVAERRGRLLAQAGAGSVVDATAGLGFDAAGLVAAGLAVTAIERDPAIAALLRHNVPLARVLVGEAQALVPDLEADAVVVDPARRVPGQRTADGQRAQSERDPARWSPPLPWVIELARTHRVVAKVAPGFHDIPEGWHAEWVSVGRTVVETALWSFPAIAARQAVVVDSAAVHVLTDGAGARGDAAASTGQALEHDSPLLAPGSHLLEPDPAVVAAALGPQLAARIGAHTLPGTHWLAADTAVATTAGAAPFARAFVIEEELPSATKELRRALRDRDIANPTIKSLGTGIDANALRRELRARAGTEATIAMLRLGDRMRAYRVTPA